MPDDFTKFLEERMTAMETAKQDMIDLIVDRLSEWQEAIDDEDTPEPKRIHLQSMIELYANLVDELMDFEPELPEGTPR
jgi:hypothetical protein